MTDTVAGMGNYRRVAPVIEARQLTSTNAEELAAWCGGEVVHEARVPSMGWPAEHYPLVSLSRMSPRFRPRLTQGWWLIKVGSDTFESLSNKDFEREYAPA